MKDSKIYKIGSMFCNEEKIITLRYLTGLMLDISTIQASRVEKNLGAMDKKVWLLYAWDIEFIKPIKEGDEVEITTIPTHMKRFYAYRNFFVKKDGEILAKAKASFILFDWEKMRAAIIDKSLAEAYGVSTEDYKGRPYKKKDNLDQNLHVNNGVYFDYIKEIPSFDEGKLSYIKMIYKNQIKEQEKVELFYKESDKQVDFELRSEISHAYGVVEYV